VHASRQLALWQAAVKVRILHQSSGTHMSGEIIRQGDPTSHNGTVLEGSLTDICHGKPIAFIGHKVSCPKCKGIFPIIEGVTTTTFYGKGVAIAGMKTACGAVLIATQFTDVVEVGTGGGEGSRAESAARTSTSAFAGSVGEDRATTQNAVTDPNKKVTRLYWTYGEEETPVSGKSRFYIDLNLHIETENYADGENVEILIENDSGSDVATGHQALKLQATVKGDGTAKIRNVFMGKTVDITANA
jgi:uncharacterized Zn-binding protein involved in type VI secretion